MLCLANEMLESKKRISLPKKECLIMKLRHSYAIVFFGSLFACGGASSSMVAPANSPVSPAPTATGLEATALDGRSFEVMLEMQDAAPVKDTLRFTGGRFESTACTALGFPQWSDYAARADGDAITFHVIAKHPSGTTMDWNGIIKGGVAQGTASRTMNGKTDVMKFKGART
jgi:hypothetical protein